MSADAVDEVVGWTYGVVGGTVRMLLVLIFVTAILSVSSFSSGHCLFFIC